MAYRLRLVRQNALKLRVRPGLQARLQGATGVNVAYAGGVYTAALDYAAFGTIPGIEAGYRGASYLLVFNRTLGLYQVISYNDLLATISATLDPTLVAIAGLAPVADQGLYFSGPDSASLYALTAFARTLLDDPDAAAARATLGLVIGTDVQAFDATLAALAGVVAAADKLIYATGADAFATADLTAFARTLLDDANAAAARATLGLIVGSDVQAFDADLSALAALGAAGFAVRTAANAWTQRALQGTANEIAVANGDGVSGNPVVSLPSALTLTGKTIAGGTFAAPAFSSHLDIAETATPANPPADTGRLYVKDNAGTTTLYFRDPAGAETNLLAGGGSGGAPAGAQYLTLATDGTLSAERVLTAGNGLTLADAGAGATATLAVGAGAGITVNADDVAVNFASQADQEAATSTVTAVSPGRQHYHDGHPKAVIKLTGLTGTPTITMLYNSLGTLSASRTAAGDHTLSWTSTLTNPMATVTSRNSGANANQWSQIHPTGGLSATSLRIQTGNQDGTYVDPAEIHVVIFGNL